MKSTLLLLPLLLCAVQFCKGQQIDSVHQKKAERIIERLASKKDLPSLIHCIDSLYADRNLYHYHDFYYYTKRTIEKTLIDSVYMDVTVDDSLMVLNFYEEYRINKEEKQSYSYNIDRGELTYAMSRKFLLNHQQGKGKEDDKLYLDKSGRYTDGGGTNYGKDPMHDSKVEAFYEPKLLASIDELYDLLFK